MTAVFATAGPSAYWYLARGTGVVSLLLLTASVVLGVLDANRFTAGARWPRFAVDSLHRDVSLLVIAVLAVHIVTSILDAFAPIRLVDAFIPLASSYRPLWMGFGALSFDLLLALVITSLLRRRLGYRAWRAIHWLAYASWPVAVLHGLGTGSDVKVWWMVALTAVCVFAVLAAVWSRLPRLEGDLAPLRAPAALFSLAVPLGLAVFALAGPFERGWARRAGTPTRLLASARPTAVSASRPAATSAPTLHPPFNARLAGTVTQTEEPDGAIVDLLMRMSGGARGRLRVRLAGAPIGGGGLSMTGSQVDLSAVGLPSALQGRIVSLQGQQFLARLTDAAGTVLEVRVNLNIDSGSGAVTGSLRARAVRGGGG